MAYLALRPLGDTTPISRLEKIGGVRADSAVRIGIPLLSGVLTTTGLVLNHKNHPAAIYWLIAGGALTAVLAAAEILSAEEARGPIR